MHNQFNDVEFDPVKARANMAKHKVSFVQAQHALRDPFSVTWEDRATIGEQRFITAGADQSGNILIVIHTQRGDRTRLISARKASKGEKEQYHAQRI